MSFPSPDQIIVRYGEETTKTLTFTSPGDHQDIRWYLETYASQYTTDMDDKRADGIVARLPEWGEKLFHAVFSDINANRLFLNFYNLRACLKILKSAAKS